MNTYAVNRNNMKIVGKFPSNKKADTNEGTVIIKSTDDLKDSFTCKELTKLFNNYSDKKIIKFSTKSDAASRVMKLLANKTAELIDLSADEESHKRAAKKPRKQREDKFLKLIEAFREGGHKTIQDLLAYTGYKKPSTVIVRISYLRSDKHEWKMNIIKYKKTDTWMLHNDDGTPYVPAGKKLSDIRLDMHQP